MESTWRGAQWTQDLYLLAIAADPALKSLRDLRGRAGLKICTEMLASLRAVALNVYGVKAGQLASFFITIREFYRLHAHCTRCGCQPWL